MGNHSTHYHLARLQEFFASSTPPRVSFEFFPPKTPQAEKALHETIATLEGFKPEFVSVTYGAGGSTREKTHQTVVHIRENTSLKPAAHLTCVAATKEEVNEVAQGYWDAGIRHIVALRGDPPGGEKKFTPHPGGYAHSAELVASLKEIGDFEISVAAFPETHPDAVSPEADIAFLKEKIDAGATRAITQYFFDTELYFSFMERVQKAGITVPVVPGIFCIAGFQQLVNFSNRCGATVPGWVANIMEGMDEHPERREALSVLIVSEQCRMLMEAGIDQFHFYTLNRAPVASTVCRILGIR